MPASAHTAATAARCLMFLCFVIRLSSLASGRRSKTEPIRSLFRTLHAFLVVTLPDLRPRAAEDIRHCVIECLAGRHRRGMAFDRKALRNALHDRERLALVGFADLIEVLDDADRLDECFRVVEDDFLFDADHLAAAVLARRVYLDGLELVAELEPAVRDPTLDVRRPGNQR